jgi:predicted outer membrane protein
MKKSFLLLIVASVSMAAFAQPGNGGFQRRTPQDRAAVIHQKLDSAFKLDAAKLAILDTALIALYKAQDAKRQELMSGGNFDREKIQEEMKKFQDAQAEILKAVLTKDEYEIWKEKIAPSMRPQRPVGGGPPGGGN